METLTLILALSSFVLQVVRMILDYLKSKEQKKDEIWETAFRLVDPSSWDADQFAKTYMELKVFKKNGCTIPEGKTLQSLLNDGHGDQDHIDEQQNKDDYV